MNIHEVAKAAGVSVTTVSRVVNHPELVAEKTRERVLEIIRGSDYAANRGYITKHGEKKLAIAVIIPSEFNYRKVYDGVQSVAVNKNFGVQLCITNYDSEVLHHNIRSLIAQQIDGFILANENVNTDTLSIIKKAGIPFVGIGGEQHSYYENMCYINYYDSACKMAQYIIDSENEHIWLFLSKHESDCKTFLRLGLCDTWKKHDKSMDNIYIFETNDSYKGGYLAGIEGLRKKEKIPDMILCQYDEVAIGLMKAATELKIPVPQQLHIAGFNDSAVSTFISPELTSVEHPTFRLGAVAARSLIDIIEESEYFDVETHQITLKGRVKIRRSCGNKKAIYETYE